MIPPPGYKWTEGYRHCNCGLSVISSPPNCLSPQTNVTLQNLTLNVNYSVQVSLRLLQLRSTTCCFSLKRLCKWHFIFLLCSLILGGWGERRVCQQPVELHVPTLPLKGDLLHCRSELVTVDAGMIGALRCTSISVSSCSS